jgi:ADP-dependent phosphofructokinase/glucokinase
VVLGLGANVDHEVEWDAELLGELARLHDIRPDELDPEAPVRSERDLVRSVLGFLRSGAGGERYAAAPDVLTGFASRFPRRTTLGGTSVRAALAMRALGVRSTVHLVSVDDDVRRLLPAGVSYVSSGRADATHPHLIVQFPAGASVRVGAAEVRAPRGNRLIYVHDPANADLVLSPDLGRLLGAADVVLLSGFNSMRDEAALRSRLVELRGHLSARRPGGLVVYEDAGFHVPALSTVVRELLADHVDVWGMNEDELQAYAGRPLDLLDAGEVLGALRSVRALLGVPTVVVHTSAWAAALGERSPALRDALHRGVRLAGARHVRGDALDRAAYDAVTGSPVSGAGQRLTTELERLAPGDVAAVPALDLRPERPTTIGLGDAFVGGFLAAVALEHDVR